MTVPMAVNVEKLDGVPVDRSAMYRDYPQEVYESCTWTGTGSMCVVCIRFVLQDVH
jgi:hypothetical protein